MIYSITNAASLSNDWLPKSFRGNSREYISEALSTLYEFFPITYTTATMRLPDPIFRKISELRTLTRRVRETSTSPSGDSSSLAERLIDVFIRTWDLGFTAFGGPPVHFQIMHQRFVEGKGGKQKWVDEQTVSSSRSKCCNCFDREKAIYSIIQGLVQKDIGDFLRILR